MKRLFRLAGTLMGDVGRQSPQHRSFSIASSPAAGPFQSSMKSFWNGGAVCFHAEPPILIASSERKSPSNVNSTALLPSTPPSTPSSKLILAGVAGVLAYISFMMAAQSYYMEKALNRTQEEVQAYRAEMDLIRGRLEALESIVYSTKNESRRHQLS